VVPISVILFGQEHIQGALFFLISFCELRGIDTGYGPPADSVPIWDDRCGGIRKCSGRDGAVYLYSGRTSGI